MSPLVCDHCGLSVRNDGSGHYIHFDSLDRSSLQDEWYPCNHSPQFDTLTTSATVDGQQGVPRDWTTHLTGHDVAMSALTRLANEYRDMARVDPLRATFWTDVVNEIAMAAKNLDAPPVLVCDHCGGRVITVDGVYRHRDPDERHTVPWVNGRDTVPEEASR